MDEFEKKKKLAESLRELIYQMPRRNREYELLYQPTILVSHSALPDTKITLKFTIGFGNYAYPCKMLVEREGAYIHVRSVGPYLDRLFIRGKAEVICSEFVQWMKFARHGTVEGRFVLMIHDGKPVGFMVQPENNAFCYIFSQRVIMSCGIKPEKVFETYTKESYRGDLVGCVFYKGAYMPNETLGKGVKPVSSLHPDMRRTLIWSFLCLQSLLK